MPVVKCTNCSEMQIQGRLTGTIGWWRSVDSMGSYRNNITER